nr:hypothetical protein [uncultured Sphaerochaeta sp.]
MSGRCALYACLLDVKSKNENNIAYVPAYTCETVLASYEKAGHTLRFYDVDEHELTPLFTAGDLKGVSVLNLCGYYGFSRYDEQFLALCKNWGVTIIQDTTHSVFSRDGHSPYADYWAGSLRKWMGIACGGVGIKKEGVFSIKNKMPDENHLEGRYLAMEYRKQALESGDATYDALAGEVFWETEMRLREMFDVYGSDSLSRNILESMDFNTLIQRRRDNYETVITHYRPSSQCQVIFPRLDDNTCPSHFSWYSEDRNGAQQFLLDHGIRSTIYWPKPPQLINSERFPHASWIYDHVMSVQIDQRYTAEDMEYLGSILSQM